MIRYLHQSLPLAFLNCLAAFSISRSPVFGPFQPRNFSSLLSSSSVATKNFSISERTCLGRSRASSAACSRCEWRGDGNEAIVSDRVVVAFSLNDFKHADDSALEDKAGGGRGVMQDQRVDGIAVFTLGGWNKTPIVGIGQPEDQRL